MNIDKDWFKRLYDIGYNDRQIAEIMGFATDSVYNYRRRMGLPSHRKYFDYGKFMELYQKGYNDVQIASELGFTKETVGTWRRRNKLPTQKEKRLAKIDRIIEEKEDIITELYFKGYADCKIGQILKIPINIVVRWRVQNKLPVASITVQDKIVPLGEENSLYCDTEFLESFFNKKFKERE